MDTTINQYDKAIYPVRLNIMLKNERVVICEVFVSTVGPFYLQYHEATGWRDLEHGDTPLSLQMSFLYPNPFSLK